MRYRTVIASQIFAFDDLKQVMAYASPERSGDTLAGISAATAQERMAARHVLADVPLKQFLTEALIPYEDDNITRLIIDNHDVLAFAPVSHMTVGDFRNWLLSEHATTQALAALAPGSHRKWLQPCPRSCAIRI
jgi:ethanolamine ammonia-lyase large subunit